MNLLAYLSIFTLALSTAYYFFLNRSNAKLVDTYKQITEERDRQILQWKEMYHNQRVRHVALIRRTVRHYDPTQGDEE